MIIIILVALILICLIILKNKDFSNFSNNNKNCSFLNKTELINFLLEDEDNYYKTFNKSDLLVRGVKTIDEYKEKIKKSCLDISESNKNKLSKYINQANHKLRKFKTAGFDGNKCADIPWIIGITNNDYENGFPHTRKNIILLSEDALSMFNFNIVKTLIHEKIHIYQKMYPEDIKIYLDSNNFKKYLNRNEINYNIRANPDLDNYIYKMGDSVMMSVYNKNPIDITDITTYPIDDSKYEHPFEYMAYTLTNII